MMSRYCSTALCSIDRPLVSTSLLVRQRLLTKGHSLPRQRQSFRRCLAQSSAGQSGDIAVAKKRPRSSVIALISEAVSVNVSCYAFALIKGFCTNFYFQCIRDVQAIFNSVTVSCYSKTVLSEGGRHCGGFFRSDTRSLPGRQKNALTVVLCLQAAVQRFETLAGRSAMVRKSSVSFMPAFCLNAYILCNFAELYFQSLIRFELRSVGGLRGCPVG